MEHRERPKAGVLSTPVVVKGRAWENYPDRMVYLKPHAISERDWEVYLEDGTWIGTVHRYVGSLDRKVGRQKHSGIRRVLWGHHAPEWDRGLSGDYSRSDSLRRLLFLHERRTS